MASVDGGLLGGAEILDVEGTSDRVPVEEPLQIVLDGEPMAVTLRSPGDERALVLGFLFAESVIESFQDVRGVELVPCETESGRSGPSAVAVELKQPADRESLDRARRTVRATAACGACGKRSLADLDLRAPQVLAVVPPSDERERWLAAMKERQGLFRETGGVHAAGLVDPEGRLRWIAEDIGRHNAVDKVVGTALEHSTMPLSGWSLVVSGRAGYELVQKALRAGVGCMVAVGAGSSLSIDLARRGGMSLYAFAGARRGGRRYA